MSTNTAVYTGTSGVAKFDVGDSTQPEAIASVRSFSISQVGDSIVTSAMGSTAKTFLPGQTSFTGTMDLLFRDDNAPQQDLFISIGQSPATLELFPSGETTGIKLSGEVIITGHDISVDQNDAVTATVSFTGTGALTKTDL